MFPQMPSDEDLYTVDISAPSERQRHTLPPIRTLLATELDLDNSGPYSPSKASPPPPSNASNALPSFERSHSQYVTSGHKFLGPASKPGTREHLVRAATVSHPYYLPSLHDHDLHDITTTHHQPFVSFSPFSHTQSLSPTPGAVASPAPSEGHSHSDESSHHGQEVVAPPTPSIPQSAPNYHSIIHQTIQRLISTPPTVRQPRRDKPGGGNVTSPNNHNQGVIRPEDVALLRRHICPICGERFNRLCDMWAHERVHTGCRPFKCPHPDCGKMFTVASNVRRHARKDHGVGAGVSATTDNSTLGRTHNPQKSSSASSDVEMESGSGSGSGSLPGTGEQAPNGAVDLSQH